MMEIGPENISVRRAFAGGKRKATVWRAKPAIDDPDARRSQYYVIRRTRLD
jgi:hypothetical protein